jgi:ATP-dependent helicase/nuclease subunit A
MSKLTDQQQEAVETIDKHVLVCAGAGSGKTHVLIERFVHILRSDPTLSVTHVVAVTFTRKAASEMRNRLKAKFRELADAEPERSQRWNECLCEVDGARIGTIHSLCESIIKSFPVDAGIDPQFELIDELSYVEMISAAIDRAFGEALTESNGDRPLLFHEFDIDDLRRLVSEAIKSSRFAEASRLLTWQNREALDKHVSTVIRDARKRLLKEILNHREWKRNLNAVEAIILTPANNLEHLRKDFVAFAKTLSESLCQHSEDEAQLQRAWEAAVNIACQKVNSTGGKSEECKELRGRMKLVRELCRRKTGKLPMHPAPDEERAWQCVRAISTLVDKCRAAYNEQKKKELLLDYNDLITLAFAALRRDQSAALRFFRESVRTLLVDEFQDTNGSQSELLSLIAGADAKFFLIGDDKQSIYRFQGADVSTFNHWRRQFEISDASVTLNLSHSFRSHPQLVRLTNLIFSRLMESNDSADGYAAIFEPLMARRQEADGNRVQLIAYGGAEQGSLEDQGQLEHSSTKAKDPDSRHRIEAEAVADWIEWHVRSGTMLMDKESHSERAAQFGDFAVLVPRNADFLLIERMLTARNIPTCVVAGKGYLERQEIYDLENLLRFLGAPQDDHALLAVLRSPMFAISDDLLHDIVTTVEDSHWQSLWQKVGRYALNRLPEQNLAADPKQPMVLARAVRILSDLLAQKDLQSLSELLRTIVFRTNYDLILLTAADGAQRLKNVWKLLNIASEHGELGCAEFADLLFRMRKAEVKIGDAPVNRENAVKIMTIHSAKGLEFPFVALPALSARNAAKSDRLLYHKEYGIAFNTARTDEDEKPLWFQACKVIDEQMELAERKRLFYVAITRARDHMAFFVDKEVARESTFSGWLLDGLDLAPEDLAENQERVFTYGDAHLPIRIIQHAYLQELTRRNSANALVQGLFTRLKEAVGEDFTPDAAQASGQAPAREPISPELPNLQLASPSAGGCELASPDEAQKPHEWEECQEIIEKANPEVLAEKQVSLEQGNGFAVVADEGGQMRILFPEQAGQEHGFAASLDDEQIDPVAASIKADERTELADDGLDFRCHLRPAAEAVDDLFLDPARDFSLLSLVGDDNEPRSLSNAFPLLEDMPQLALDFPAAWLGCLRVSPGTERRDFPATVIGTFFHSLMENMPGDGRPLERERIEAIAFSQAGVVPLPGNVKALADLGEELLSKFYKSDFYQLFLHAGERLHEMPYIFRKNGVTHSRRPDLLLRLSNGKWLLIDFKTDHFSEAELHRHSREHAQQLTTYAEELQELLQIQLQSFIYYARYGLLHPC